jgi:L-aminopeptidase/D-esterase-like protein
VLLFPEGTVASVDVRGGGPGTRETDLLHPTATMPTIHAICLTGGSAFGLAAAGGVMQFLEERGIGFAVGTEPAHVVPIVPGAVIFDLGRGGAFGNRPDESFGHRAAAAARARPSPNGAIGAGTGARARGMQGGVGTASTVLPNGVVVSALAVVNSAGTVIDPATGLPYMPGSTRLRRPPPPMRRATSPPRCPPCRRSTPPSVWWSPPLRSARRSATSWRRWPTTAWHAVRPRALDARRRHHLRRRHRS